MNSSPESSSLKLKTTYISIIILLTVIVYFNSLKGSFQFDDRNLLNKEWVSNLDSFNTSVPLNLQSVPTRPILIWTFALNNHLDNKNTIGFHLINLTLHILVTLLIFTILIRIKSIIPKRYVYEEKEKKKIINYQRTDTLLFPFATSLIFALHPINTDSVAYISSRSTLLATFFYLLTIYFFIETLLISRTVKQRIILGLLTILGIYLALASKLIAVTLPVVLIFCLLVIYLPKYFSDYAKYFTFTKMVWFFMCSGLVLITSTHYLGILYLPRDQGLELFGRAPYFLIQFKVVIFYYLKEFLLPFNLNADIGFPFTKVVTDWRILFSVFLIVTIILGVLKWGNIWFKIGCAWFFLTISPTSSIIPLNDLAVEHRMYLPISLGLCLLVGWLISSSKKNIQIVTLLFIVSNLGILVVERNKIWTNEIKLWSDSALKNPNSSRVHNNLGKAYFEKGKLIIARTHLEKSVASIPEYVQTQFNIKNKNLFKADFAEPHFNLASVYLDLGELEDAETEYQTALYLKPDYYAAELGIGSVKNLKKDYDLAIQHFINSIAIMKKTTGQPDYPLARLNLGEVYGKTQRYNDAVIEFNKAVKADPSMFLAHFNLGTAYMLMGLDEKAEKSFKECLNLNPNHEPALFNLGRVYQNQELWEQSNRIFKIFLKIKSPNPTVYSAMAWNTLMSGDLEEASKLYEKVLRYEVNNQEALINLAKINYSLGKISISESYIKRALKLDLLQSQSNELEKLLK